MKDARERWPALELPVRGFVDFVFAREDAAPAQLHLSDIYLAYGCVVGSPAASEIFVREFAADIDGVYRRTTADMLAPEDLRQLVVQHLLLRDDESKPPRIALFRGRGRLRYWVRIVAARVLADAGRGNERETGSDTGLDVLPAPDDPPDAAYLRHYYREQFETAMRNALSRLEGRDRDLLRYSVVDRMPTAAIAAMLGVHRGTAARWLKEAREHLLWGARDALAEDFDVPRGELDSVMRLARSQFALSVGRLLEKNPKKSG